MTPLCCCACRLPLARACAVLVAAGKTAPSELLAARSFSGRHGVWRSSARAKRRGRSTSKVLWTMSDADSATPGCSCQVLSTHCGRSVLAEFTDSLGRQTWCNSGPCCSVKGY